MQLGETEYIRGFCREAREGARIASARTAGVSPNSPPFSGRSTGIARDFSILAGVPFVFFFFFASRRQSIVTFGGTFSFPVPVTR